MKWSTAFTVGGLVAVLAAGGSCPLAAAPAGEARKPSKLFDPGDGWFDISAFLDESYGFAPILMPVTEPALGYGVAGALVFIDKQPSLPGAGYRQPDLAAVGGLVTENANWGAAGLDSRHWRNDRLQTIVAAGYAELHLDYYGLGEDSELRNHPLSYSLSPAGGQAQVKHRLGKSRFQVGLAYALAEVRVEFGAGDGAQGIPPFEADTWQAGLTPSANYDSRNNLFTPTRGIYAEALCRVFSQALGGDADHQRAELVWIGYHPLHPKVTVGAKVAGRASFGEVPFYMRPYVSLRGLAALSYQGEQVAEAEAEVRYQFWKRISLVGFGGAGSAWSGSDGEESRKNVQTAGTGVRYELARKYGLHMGLDVAWGPDLSAIYVQFGNAWMRL